MVDSALGLLKKDQTFSILEYFLSERINKYSIIAPSATAYTVAMDIGLKEDETESILKEMARGGLLKRTAEHTNVIFYGIMDDGIELYKLFERIEENIQQTILRTPL